MENPLTCSTMPGNFTDDENVPSELCPVKTQISLHICLPCGLQRVM